MGRSPTPLVPEKSAKMNLFPISVSRKDPWEELVELAAYLCRQTKTLFHLFNCRGDCQITSALTPPAISCQPRLPSPGRDRRDKGCGETAENSRTAGMAVLKVPVGSRHPGFVVKSIDVFLKVKSTAVTLVS